MVVTYHPKVLLRASADKAKAWADLCLAMDVELPRSAARVAAPKGAHLPWGGPRHRLPTIGAMTFLDQLRTAERQNGSLLCVGLDPEPAKFPEHLPG